MQESLYAGIDAGGTSTRCVVADAQGDIMGVGRGGPGNALIAGHDGAFQAYESAVREASAGVTRRPTHLHIAAAGTQIPDRAHELAITVSSSNDAPAAFAGALVQGPGLIVIAGTGSVVYGERADGRTILIGGWGPLAGDEGSGFAIGRDALRLLAQAVDGRIPSSQMTDAFAEHFGTLKRSALQARFYQPPLPREEVAALTSIVALAALAGDAAARGILEQAADDLAETVADGARLLGLREDEVRVATLGGVWSVGDLMLKPFARRLRERAPGARVLPARYPPVIGALLLAYRQASVPVTPELLDRLTAGLDRWSLG